MLKASLSPPSAQVWRCKPLRFSDSRRVAEALLVPLLNVEPQLRRCGSKGQSEGRRALLQTEGSPGCCLRSGTAVSSGGPSEGRCDCEGQHAIPFF